MARADYRISVEGRDVTAAFDPRLIALEIEDGDGGKTDTCEITLDDEGGRIVLPAAGSSIEAWLWWAEPPPGASSGSVHFTGKTDEPRSHGSRQSGRILRICAHSADLKGKGKTKRSKHYDDETFGEVAKDLGSAAGYSVTVDSSLASIRRDYWVCAHESFLSWGRRIAGEIGATFKVSYPKAAFVPRNSGQSAAGAALATVRAVWGENLIGWDAAPKLSRGLYKNAKQRVYDHRTAKWSSASESVGAEGAEADLHETFKAADQDRAGRRCKSNAYGCQRKQGAARVEIDGDPAAQAQARLALSGARPGIDGTYTIASARHRYDRHGGWTTSCALEQPAGDAGTDSR